MVVEATLRHKQRLTKLAKATLILQSTCVTKLQVNDLPFAAGTTKIEKVRPFFL